MSKTLFFFFFQAGDGIRYLIVTGVQTCALPIFLRPEPPDDLHALGEPAHPLPQRHPEDRELLRAVAEPHAQHEAPAGDHVEKGPDLRDLHRVVQRQQHQVGPDGESQAPPRPAAAASAATENSGTPAWRGAPHPRSSRTRGNGSAAPAPASRQTGAPDHRAKDAARSGRFRASCRRWRLDGVTLRWGQVLNSYISARQASPSAMKM